MNAGPDRRFSAASHLREHRGMMVRMSSDLSIRFIGLPEAGMGALPVQMFILGVMLLKATNQAVEVWRSQIS
jgi:hypothetical protein